MPEFRLYNTLSRAVEPFIPAKGKTVRMYTCGPTVYNPAHVGNFRTFLFEDLLRRVIELRGWKVLQVMNLTDVDDKIIKRATEHLPEMIDLVRKLVERGIAYQAEDGSVYYAIDRFKGYGRLSRLDTREI